MSCLSFNTSGEIGGEGGGPSSDVELLIDANVVADAIPEPIGLMFRSNAISLLLVWLHT